VGPAIRMFWNLKIVLDFQERLLCKNVDFIGVIFRSTAAAVCTSSNVLFALI